LTKANHPQGWLQRKRLDPSSHACDLPMQMAEEPFYILSWQLKSLTIFWCMIFNLLKKLDFKSMEKQDWQTQEVLMQFY